MHIFLIIFIVFALIVGLVGIGLGYLIHWILPITLDTSMILGFMLGYISFNVAKSFLKPLNKFEEDEEQEIVLSAKDVRNFYQPSLRKSRKK
jgi:Kef-type K+ transport system membrane component KefB